MTVGTFVRSLQSKTVSYILKRERILVPPAPREETLKTIHEGHLGQEKCLPRARSAVFWPGITKDVVNLVAGCDARQKHKRKQQKQELLQPEPPCYPCQILNSDLFEYKGNQYLLLSDEYSKFPIIRKLTSTTSHAIINHLKSIFAEYGIPDKLVIYNGPNIHPKSSNNSLPGMDLNTLQAHLCTHSLMVLRNVWSKLWNVSLENVTRTVLIPT